MSEFQSLAGKLLVAMPGIGDPRFEHAVILICAHRADHAMGLRLDRPAPDASMPAGEGLAITATREALAAMTDTETRPGRSVLVLGYAGWGEGQLEDELTENVWLTAEPTLELLFDEDHATKWSRALAGIGVDAAMLSAKGGRA